MTTNKSENRNEWNEKKKNKKKCSKAELGQQTVTHILNLTAMLAHAMNVRISSFFCVGVLKTSVKGVNDLMEF